MITDDQPGLKKLKALNDRLTALLDDPQPGLITWMMALSSTLTEMIDYAGHGKVSDKIREGKL